MRKWKRLNTLSEETQALSLQSEERQALSPQVEETHEMEVDSENEEMIHDA